METGSTPPQQPPSAAGNAGGATGSGSRAAGAARPESGMASGPGSARMISSDFETFLDMLTTQMKNQDPLNPMKSAEFATQLATFSGVEQQVRTNELLKDLVGGDGAGTLSQYADWIGMEARNSAPARFDGAPITVTADPPEDSDKAELIVRDAEGTEVARQPITAEAGPTTWRGTGSDGRPLPHGDYTFQIEGFAEGQSLGTRPAETYARVAEARAGENGAVLVLDTGETIPAKEVTALRAPTREQAQ